MQAQCASLSLNISLGIQRARGFRFMHGLSNKSFRTVDMINLESKKWTGTTNIGLANKQSTTSATSKMEKVKKGRKYRPYRAKNVGAKYWHEVNQQMVV